MEQLLFPVSLAQPGRRKEYRLMGGLQIDNGVSKHPFSVVEQKIPATARSFLIQEQRVAREFFDAA
jgi:hypothetical protein